MASENKKRKIKSRYVHKSALKWKGKGPKGIAFYNSAQRKQQKRCSV